MNKYIEALNNIRLNTNKAYVDVCYHIAEKPKAMKYEQEVYNSCKVLEELVEKVTPKAPNFNRGIEIQSWDGDCCSTGYTHDYWSCPNCDGYLCKANDEDAVGEYCTQCGQRFDKEGDKND